MSKKYNEIEVKDNMKIEEEVDVEVVNDDKDVRKELKQVTTVKPAKKKGLMGRLITGLVGPEGLPGIGAYVNDEIVKPAIKNIIVDSVTSGINMVMYGEKGGQSRGGYRPHSSGGYRSGYRPNTNYSNNYRNITVEPKNERVITKTPRASIEEYTIEDRYDAAHVLTTLTETADRYDSVSVADYYDLIGVPSQYTDNNVGWRMDTITRASIIPVRGGYVIKFPPVEVL